MQDMVGSCNLFHDGPAAMSTLEFEFAAPGQSLVLLNPRGLENTEIVTNVAVLYNVVAHLDPFGIQIILSFFIFNFRVPRL